MVLQQPRRLTAAAVKKLGINNILAWPDRMIDFHSINEVNRCYTAQKENATKIYDYAALDNETPRLILPFVF
jgi:hypothetical protein